MGAALVIACVLAGGCATGGESEPQPEDLTLLVTLNKSVYRPGEIVEARVKLANNTNEQLELPKLSAADGGSISFWYSLATEPDASMQRPPVVSRLERPEGLITLAPGQSEERTFVLTRLAEYSGPMLLQVHYDPNPAGSGRTEPKIFSNPVAYDVKGELLFGRDPSGYLMEEEAIGLANAVAPGEVRSGDAILIEDEMGFYKWWVNLQVQREGGQTQTLAWLVDPYFGRVIGQAQPFPENMQNDPRTRGQKSLRRDPSRPDRVYMED
ncbi:MAG: hypothetical protein BWZ08_01180 [candidate division BRC1 bacterium ADurb.BinA292]|nr:MAG: hypothetical protein BWZ08_01180 [candidate division BRC1 bacterium ADurb.BinA292]